MALQSSGAISLSDVAGEFGGSTPHRLSEYYNAASGIPSSGAISLSDFYGASAAIDFSTTISSSTQELIINSSYFTSRGWDGLGAITLTINSGVYIWSDNVSTAGLTIDSSLSNKNLTIVNNGYIIGKGGRGSYAGQNGEDGGPAVSNSASGVSLTNNSYVAGGGGGGTGAQSDDRRAGGGGGAGGGEGGGITFGQNLGGGGAGGAIGQVGSDGSGGPYGDSGIAVPARGGGAGGGGGAHDYVGSDTTSRTGAGGGRILGSGATGGAGGTATGGRAGAAGGANGDVGGSSQYGAGGGGGWGAAGGRGDTSEGGSVSAGAGGAAISGVPISVTNNGTIYGTQA